MSSNRQTPTRAELQRRLEFLEAELDRLKSDRDRLYYLHAIAVNAMFGRVPVESYGNTFNAFAPDENDMEDISKLERPQMQV